MRKKAKFIFVFFFLLLFTHQPERRKIRNSGTNDVFKRMELWHQQQSGARRAFKDF